MLESGDYDFSFSGLKTAVRKLVESSQPLTDDVRAAIAMEVEDAIVETLITKTMRAAEEHNASTIIVGGGVAANAYLREQFVSTYPEASPRGVLFPGKGLSTDNAVMIALAGWFRAYNGEYADVATLRADGNMRLS
jgi:N6-L-threonylcarbamoyladenine synthase